MKLASEWLHSCGGCEAALLDTGDNLLTLLEQVEIVHMPLLLDRGYGQSGQPALPRADIGLISGGVALKEHRRILRAMRACCRILVAVGTCATHGGIPALINQWGLQNSWTALRDSAEHTEEAALPLERVFALDELVAVDLLLPGCPPDGDQLVELLTCVATGRPWQTSGKSVCETCPADRTGTRPPEKPRRLLQAPSRREKPLRCLLEQGFVCMGPVTAGGCGGTAGPHCLRVGMPCRGCLGPVQGQGNQMLAMMNILASTGVDFRALVDRRGLLRFAGAHGRLQPQTEKKAP